MKWAVACLCALIALFAVAFAAETTHAEKLAQYESQLAQLQQQEAALKAEHGVTEFSFKQNFAATQAAAAQAGVGADQGKLRKLAAAMTAVKEDIMAKLREAQRESSWVKEVEKIVTEYKKKVKNVKKNLAKIRKDIKELIKKKRQIRNAQIQEQLADRLNDASGDLKMVQGKLESINAQQKAFENNRKKIADTIAKINAEIMHLRGEKPAEQKAAVAAAQTEKANKKFAEKNGDKKKAVSGDKKKGKKQLPKEIKEKCKTDCKDDKACFKKCAKAELKKLKESKEAAPKAFVEADSEEELLAEFAF